MKSGSWSSYVAAGALGPDYGAPDEEPAEMPGAMRRFVFTVHNGLGDEARVPIRMDDAARPEDFRLAAIARARAILPDEKPWRVVAMEEL